MGTSGKKTHQTGHSASTQQPHAVCIPYPAQGHINPMLKLAKLLHFNGFFITFVNTEYNHRRLLRSKGPNSLDGLPSFQFKTIPDGLPQTDTDVTQDIRSLCLSTSKNCLAPFLELLSKLNDTTSTSISPPVTCIVSDGSMSFTLDAARELGIPDVLFRATSACGFLGYFYLHQLVEKGYVPLKDESYLTNGYLDSIIDFIPGLKDVRLKDFPTLIRTTDPNDLMLHHHMRQVERYKKASAIVLNTFDELEHDAISALSSQFPPVYSIGPLHLLINHVTDNDLKPIGANLWKEDPECLDWLDSKEPKSVVYVNFGSITVMTSDQLREFAWGLANSDQTFLWVIRPDLIRGDNVVLPPEFMAATKERSMLVSWCPQEQVLKHSAIGGFLTHSGWNSTLESISAGVPIICWPFFADQQMNCRFSCVEWGVGMEINNDVKRDEIESLVRELMEGIKGEEMRKKAMDWKKLAEESCSLSGSSYKNFTDVINNVLLCRKH